MRGCNSQIFEDLKTMIGYYQALGLDSLPIALEKEEKVNPDPALEKEEKVNPDPASDKNILFAELKEEIGDCMRCKLSSHRKNVVFGEGDPDARIMFIGEAPGREEDIQGMPFVGEAGMLLTRLIEKMGLKRSDVYIANIIKCRPPMNRDPEADEIAACRAFLDKQIQIIKPEIIITLGRIALQSIMGDPKIRITTARGNFFQYKGIPVMPTFHPAYLLRNPKDKWLTWTDAQKVMEKIR